MKGLIKLAILGGLMAASAAPALADTISVFDGAVGASITPTSINFGAPAPQSIVLANTFAFLNTTPVSFTLGTFNYVSGGTVNFAPFVIASQASVPYGTVTFSITSVTESNQANNGVTLTGMGFFTLGSGPGAQTVSATYILQNGGNGINFIATANSAATPEPSSLVLLGTGLLSAAGLAFRKRLTA